MKNVSTLICFCDSGNGNIVNSNFLEFKNFLSSIPETEIIHIDTSQVSKSLAKYARVFSNGDIKQILLTGSNPGFVKDTLVNIWINRKNVNIKLKIISLHLNSNQHRNEIEIEIAKSRMLGEIYNIPNEVLLKNGPNENFKEDTLVIGGGIAGIQASLEIANAGYNVFLIEKSGTIGGHMAMFDKTFPTLDCAACILTPKMVEVGQHEHIELLTNSEVESVTGSSGNYKVRILKKARRVDISKCIGCGSCAAKCPGKSASEFDAGTSFRKAIYLPFPQAVPNKYLIDPESCLYVQKGRCKVCIKECPVDGCIDLDEKDEIVEVNVGNIVVSTGFKTFDPGIIQQYGYGKYQNVITSLELERLINAAGPTGGQITFPLTDKKGNRVFAPDGDAPSSFAIIHCVGSRDRNYHEYCSRVCCMYSLKLAHLIKEKLPEAEVSEFFIDMRCYGKGYEEFYNRISSEGIQLVRGKIASIKEGEKGLLIRAEDIQSDTLIEKQVDMVVLSVGLELSQESKELAEKLNITVGEDGWLKELDDIYSSTETNRGGIFVVGTCQGPKDIPDTVIQASSVASRVISSIITKTAQKGFNELKPAEVLKTVKELST